MSFLRFLFRNLLRLLKDNRGFATLNLTTTTELADAIPEKWDAKVRVDSSRKAFWDKFEGKEGSMMPIIVRNDFTKEPGDLIHVQVVSQLLQVGITGESTLQGNEEKLSLGQFDVPLDWLRHAVSFTKKATKQANFNSVMAANNLLSTWLARKKDDALFNELLITNAPTVIYAGDATDRASLGVNDTFGVAEIDRLKVALQRQGALPIRTTRDGKQEIDIWCAVLSEMDEYELKGDPTWNQAQRDAGIRGDKNRLFSGALGMYNGVLVYSFNSVKMSGFLGSFLRPEAQLSATITATGTSISVGPTTPNANVNYTKYFPTASGTLLIGSEEITYTGRTNTTFTGITRAAGGTTGAAHTAGDLITLSNVSKVIGFGAEIAARVWGKYPSKITQTYDYGFENGVGIEAYYGERTIQDSSDNKPNCLIMECYSANPNTSI